MENQQGVFNRINNEFVINWQYVESIVYYNESNKIMIKYNSGGYTEITKTDQILKFLEFLQVFPNIMDDNTRINMIQTAKQSMSGVKTDISYNQEDIYNMPIIPPAQQSRDNYEIKKKRSIKTDIK